MGVFEFLKEEDRKRLQRFVQSYREVEGVLYELTDEQARACSYLDGHSIVYAGPGAGKTKTMVAKALTVVGAGRVGEENIAMITFTRSAAREMQERIERLLERPTRITFGTIHSFAYRIMKETGRVPHKVADEDVIREFYRPYLSELNEKLVELLKKDLTISDYLDRMGLTKKDGINLTTRNVEAIELIREKFYNFKAMVQNGITIPQSLVYEYKATNKVIGEIVDVLKKVRTDMKKEEYLSFTDILLYFYRLVEKDARFRKALSDRYGYVFVDEFQDVSYIQYASLGAFRKNIITVVGDDDQSIYTWRAAYPQIMSEFEKSFYARRFFLTKNFRSREEVVRASMLVASQMKERVGKEIVSTRGKGGGVFFTLYETSVGDYFGTLTRRADEVARVVGVLLKNFKNRDIAVLISENSASRPIERNLLNAGIPVLNLTKRSILEMKEAKWVGWLLSLFLYDNSYKELALLLKESLNGFGEKSFDRFTRLYEPGMSYKELIEGAVSSKILPAKEREFLEELIEILSQERQDFLSLGRELSLEEIKANVKGIVDGLFELFSPFLEKLVKKVAVERAKTRKPKKKELEKMGEEERERALAEYQSYISEKEFEARKNLLSVKHYIESSLTNVLRTEEKMNEEIWRELWEVIKGDIILGQKDRGEELRKEGVKIMTVHQAKGLEFPAVVFSPNPAVLTDEEGKRAVYVAVTRAKEVACIALSDLQVKKDPFWQKVYSEWKKLKEEQKNERKPK